jgi:hypothetical protein
MVGSEKKHWLDEGGFYHSYQCRKFEETRVATVT